MHTAANRNLAGLTDMSKLNIPSLPIIAVKALQVLGEKSASTDSLAKIISFDQSFTSRLLKIANSPYFNRGNSVGSIDDAVFRVGFETVRSIVVMAALKDVRRNSDVTDFGLWEHSTAVAIASRVIAEQLGTGSPAQFFIPGLLHDIGKMVMNVNFKEKYTTVIDEVRASGKAFQKAEFEVFGFTHCNMGEYVAEKWNLPAEVRNVISLHHCPASEIADRKDIFGVLLVKAADFICSELGIGIGDNFDPVERDLGFIGLSNGSQVDSIKKKVEEQYPECKSFILEQ